ncbi:hypothetical protein B0H14DRAFT_2561341 [Mycena olivaceomarginata]|nr:hypothetical protein B0H14DRAFT_2561341 [Mycena olivaceomarginata]
MMNVLVLTLSLLPPTPLASPVATTGSASVFAVLNPAGVPNSDSSSVGLLPLPIPIAAPNSISSAFDDGFVLYTKYSSAAYQPLRPRPVGRMLFEIGHTQSSSRGTPRGSRSSLSSAGVRRSSLKDADTGAKFLLVPFESPGIVELVHIHRSFLGAYQNEAKSKAHESDLAGVGNEKEWCAIGSVYRQTTGCQCCPRIYHITLVSARIGRKDMLRPGAGSRFPRHKEHIDHLDTIKIEGSKKLLGDSSRVQFESNDAWNRILGSAFADYGIGKRVIPKVLEYPTNILLQRTVAPTWTPSNSLKSYPIRMILDSSERMDQRGRLSIYEDQLNQGSSGLRELPQPNINCADCSEDGRRRLPVDGTAGKRAVLHSSRKIHRATVGGIRHTRKDGDENRERSVITKGFSFECGGEYGGHASTNSQGKAPYENVWGSLRDDWARSAHFDDLWRPDPEMQRIEFRFIGASIFRKRGRVPAKVDNGRQGASIFGRRGQMFMQTMRRIEVASGNTVDQG